MYGDSEMIKYFEFLSPKLLKIEIKYVKIFLKVEICPILILIDLIFLEYLAIKLILE